MSVHDVSSEGPLVPTQSAIACPICSSFELVRCLQGRGDHEYGLPQVLPYWRCGRSDCGHVFVAPQPSPSEIAALYGTYSTHSPARSVGLLVRSLNYFNDQGVKLICDLPDSSGLSCLDFGCGNGVLLSRLRRHGMTHLIGFDFDPVAVATARQLGLQVFNNELEALRRGPFDLIVLNHVLEHLPNPFAKLAQLSSYLAPGGRLIVRTPNAGSWLAQCFGDNWRGWETPRHLNVFTPSSMDGLSRCLTAAGLQTERLYSSNAMFLGIYHESFRSQFLRKSLAGKLLRHTLCLFALPYAMLRSLAHPLEAEELCWIGRRV